MRLSVDGSHKKIVVNEKLKTAPTVFFPNKFMGEIFEKHPSLISEFPQTHYEIQRKILLPRLWEKKSWY